MKTTKEMNRGELLAEVPPLVEAIRPILAGHQPEVQSMVMADLLALWVCGFVVFGDQAGTKEIRDAVLARHMKLVIDLIEAGVNEPRGGNN